MFLKPETKEAINSVTQVIDYYSNIFLAFVLTTSVLILIVHLINLMKNGSNPTKRSEILSNITTTLIIISVLGIFTTISKFIIYSLL